MLQKIGVIQCRSNQITVYAGYKYLNLISIVIVLEKYFEQMSTIYQHLSTKREVFTC